MRNNYPGSRVLGPVLERGIISMSSPWPSAIAHGELQGHYGVLG